MIADSRHLSGIPFLHSHLYAFDHTLPISSANYRGKGQLSAQQANPRRSIAIGGISFCAACQHHFRPVRIRLARTFVAPGHRASAGTAGIPDRSPEPGTFDQLHLDSRRLGLDRWLARIQSEVAEAVAQADSSALLEVDWGRPRVRCVHWQRALSLPQPCAGCLLPSYVASTPFEFL